MCDSLIRGKVRLTHRSKKNSESARMYLSQISNIAVGLMVNFQKLNFIFKNKLASLEATLVRNSAHPLTHLLTYSLTGVKCRATSVAKKQRTVGWTYHGFRHGSVKPRLTRLQQLGVNYSELALRWFFISNQNLGWCSSFI